MDNTQPIFTKYFSPDFSFDTKMIDVPVTVPFETLQAGTLNFTTDINIHGAGYLSGKHISAGIVPVEIAVASSDFFKRFNNEGKLAAALKISFSNAEAVTFEKRADIRVDGGLFVVCDLDYVSHIAELQKNLNLPPEKEDYEDEDIYDLLEKGKVPGSDMKTGITTAFSKEMMVDTVKTIETNAGYGDGTYPLWFAYDKDGGLAAVYVDFLLFERHDVIEQIISGR